MRLHKEDFEILKVIGRGAFGEVRPHWLPKSEVLMKKQNEVIQSRGEKNRIVNGMDYDVYFISSCLSSSFLSWINIQRIFPV